METTDYGIIQIRAFEASEALPLENVSVKIVGTGENNGYIQLSQLTDANGITSAVRLPAPPQTLSMSPGARSVPYSVFDIELAKDGYYPKKIMNIPVFSGIKAMLPVEMLPIAYDSDGSSVPLKNLNAVIYENENLN